jgi:hypothetical protein
MGFGDAENHFRIAHFNYCTPRNGTGPEPL